MGTTSGGGPRGRDNHKNVESRKRHIVVDSMGLLLAVLVTAASVDDATAAQALCARRQGQPVSWVRRKYAGSKYHNQAPYEWVLDNAHWKVHVERSPEGTKGWVKLPVRWTVERTFARLGKCRRLSKDREKSVRSSEAFIKLAMIHLMLNYLATKSTDADFQPSQAACPRIWDNHSVGPGGLRRKPSASPLTYHYVPDLGVLSGEERPGISCEATTLGHMSFLCGMKWVCPDV